MPLQMAADQPARGYAVRHPRRHHAGAGYDDRQRRAALHAGQCVGERRSDQLGADLLYRGRGHHDPAIGVSCQQVRPQAHPDGGRRRLRDCIRAVRPRAIAGPDRGLPIAARLLRRSAGSAWPVCSARHLYSGGTRFGHGRVRRIGDGRASAGAGDRRLADRPLQLAMGILYQRPPRSARFRRHIVLSEGDEDQRGGEARLARIWQLEHRYCGHAGISGPGCTTRLVLFLRNSDRGGRLRIGALHLPCPHLYREKFLRESGSCFSIEISRSGCCSSSSSG